jgi:hypothetical protein
MGDFNNLYNVLFGNPEGKRLVEEYGHRREDNIKVDP